MFKLLPYGTSNYIHICEDKTEKEMFHKAIHIRRSGDKVFSLIYERESKNPKIERISYCAYCGVDLKREFVEQERKCH